MTQTPFYQLEMTLRDLFSRGRKAKMDNLMKQVPAKKMRRMTGRSYRYTAVRNTQIIPVAKGNYRKQFDALFGCQERHVRSGASEGGTNLQAR